MCWDQNFVGVQKKIVGEITKSKRSVPFCSSVDGQKVKQWKLTHQRRCELPQTETWNGTVSSIENRYKKEVITQTYRLELCVRV